MDAVCTILDSDFLHYALSLNKSMLRFRFVKLYILITDNKLDDEHKLKQEFQNIEFLYLEDIEETYNGKNIVSKYRGVYENGLRWSLKPILMLHLLSMHKRIIFLDCDLCFFSDFKFLFDELEEHKLILTPHWRNSNPNICIEGELHHFNYLFMTGLFNAGFIGASDKGIDVLKWWARCCHHRCEINLAEGQYADQTYLNLMPIYFEGIKILRHKGCNVSEWNYAECKRTLREDGEIMINDSYPIVFIHFIGNLIRDIKEGRDHLLTPHLEFWQESMTQFISYSEVYRTRKASTKSDTNDEPSTVAVSSKERINFFHELKRKVKIRTRILAFLNA
jgi:lipopolysaccharide biosynthesis glycosyltransferase